MSTTLQQAIRFPVSKMADSLIGSEIIKLGNEIAEKIRSGEKIANMTIGDFDPAVFPIPEKLMEEIITAYREGHTNYPMANGVPELRKAVATFTNDLLGLEYSPDEVLIAGGARPIIYGIYSTLVDPGDKVIYPVPSWNNNHYCHLHQAQAAEVECLPENNFMPLAKDIRPHLKDAVLLALCSPQNPTGTIFSQHQLEEICDLVLEENRRRTPGQKPLYVMYDQIYCALVYGGRTHYNPVSLRPELRPYTIFVDGISKSFAATGVRVGWALGPQFIIDKMKAILGHIGAWSPKAEQIATARYLNDKAETERFLQHMSEEVTARLQAFYEGFEELRKEGYPLRCVEPQAAIYLTVSIDLKGRKTQDGKVLNSTADVTAFLLGEAGLAIVPFSAFGASRESTWYRLSVGTAKKNGEAEVFNRLRKALTSLS